MNSSSQSEYDYLLKLLLIGNSGVGKSCMLLRYAVMNIFKSLKIRNLKKENSFTSNFYNTIGVDFKIKSITLDNKIIKLQIVFFFEFLKDTLRLLVGYCRARQVPNYNLQLLPFLTKRGAHGIIIVYDITDRESFDNVKLWMGEIEKYAQENVKRLLVGNKADLSDKRKVTFEEGMELAKQYKIEFIETSAKNSVNIDLAFQNLSKIILEKINSSQQNNKDKNIKLKEGTQVTNGEGPSNNKSSNEGGYCC